MFRPVTYRSTIDVISDARWIVVLINGMNGSCLVTEPTQYFIVD